MSAQPAVGTAPMTADQLLGTLDDGRRRELLDGELREVPPAGFDHGRVALRIGARLDEHVRAGRLGAVVAAGTGSRLSRRPDTVRAPDAASAAVARLPPRAEQQRFPDLAPNPAPDPAVEVVSPSDRAADVVEEALAWLAAGTALVRVVHPRQRLVAICTGDGRVTHVSEGGELDGGGVLPGLRFAVADPLE